MRKEEKGYFFDILQVGLMNQAPTSINGWA